MIIFRLSQLCNSLSYLQVPHKAGMNKHHTLYLVSIRLILLI